MIAAVSKFFRAHPMLKGMAVYAVTWPTSSLLQQVIVKEDLDFKRAFRFFCFGSLFVAPSLYGWIKLSSHMWPMMTIKAGIAKAAVEQLSYGPFSGVCFFLLMSLMEGKTFKESKNEVTEKFPQTWRGKFK